VVTARCPGSHRPLSKKGPHPHPTPLALVKEGLGFPPSGRTGCEVTGAEVLLSDDEAGSCPEEPFDDPYHRRISDQHYAVFLPQTEF
jgi:hypothetical protein